MQGLMCVVRVVGLPEFGLEWHRIEPDEPASGVQALREGPAARRPEEAIPEIGVQRAAFTLTEEALSARSRENLRKLSAFWSRHQRSRWRGSTMPRSEARSPGERPLVHPRAQKPASTMAAVRA